MDPPSRVQVTSGDSIQTVLYLRELQQNKRRRLV